MILVTFSNGDKEAYQSITMVKTTLRNMLSSCISAIGKNNLSQADAILSSVESIFSALTEKQISLLGISRADFAKYQLYRVRN